jgi:anaerobic magnesium-protoporphyrin IX monomethyl ester cyclase
MKLLLINPPHPAIGSRIPVEHLPPLGLLAIGGPLLDAGHEVRLLDAEFGPLGTPEIVAEGCRQSPEAVLVGHSGSTSGHPAAMEITRAIRIARPQTRILYGGVFPTYHWREIMAAEPQIDIIVRGEGEETAKRVVHALETGTPLGNIPGIAFRRGTGSFTDGLRSRPAVAGKGIIETGRAPLIADLDAYRVGWELIDHARYSYWGNRRAVVVQFSRGCPHRCNYCGQRGFWTRWRHRDPVTFAQELARLHRVYGVEVINFADENPTASRPAWQAFLEALIAEEVPLILVGSTRADDIVRDADILHLYKRAGVARFLLGLESTNEDTLRRIRKDSLRETDCEAIRLMRQHGILSMAACVAGFEEETDRDYWRTMRQIIAYDPDQIQALYVTPHRWTPYFRMASGRRVIQTDLSRWDYKHQVLATRKMPPWRILIWMKLIEAVAQLRPRALWRYFAHPDRSLRAAMRWYYRIGRQVWPYEVWHFLFRDRRLKQGPTLAEFYGQPQDAEAEALDTGSIAAGLSAMGLWIGGAPAAGSPRTVDGHLPEVQAGGRSPTVADISAGPMPLGVPSGLQASALQVGPDDSWRASWGDL